jgi:hypothetical protein
MTMTMRTGLRRRRVIALAVGAAAAAASLSVAVPAMAAHPPSARVLAAGQTGTRAAVPWSKVGPDWALAMFSAAQGGEGIRAQAGPSTLYLVDPAGGKYSLFTWPALSPVALWQLRAWSGDTRRALFTSQSGTREEVHQLQLGTGTITSFTLPANVTVVGYTRPDGLNIIAAKWSGSAGTLQRYSLTGRLQKTLASVRDISQVAYQPDGVTLAASVADGLELVSNGGGVIRTLPVPGANGGCSPVRWWTANTILASCFNLNGQWRMWLVPASGAKPAALTPARTHPTFDFGDFNAWQLSSGLYVNGYGACGSLVLGRQPAHGPEQQVDVPGAASPLVVTATRTSLMVERNNGCAPGVSLVWFDPATHAMDVAIPTHGHEYGVVGIEPYFVTGKR